MRGNLRLTSLFFALAAVFYVLTLSGCSLSSATIVDYSSPAPPEKNCTLYIGAMTVRQFDGQTVTWKSGFGNLWAQVQIAEGRHTFVFDYQRQGEAGTFSSYEASGLSVTYDRFIAGHTYLLTAEPLTASASSMTIRVGIKDVTNEPDWASFSKALTWRQGFEWLPVTRNN